jgi:hypothetical protein
MTAPERFAEKSDSLLHRGRRPYMTHSNRLPLSIDALRKDHSITSSARPSIIAGTVKPSAFAVFGLMVSSSLAAPEWADHWPFCPEE